MIIAHISDTHIALDTPDTERRIRDFEDTVADINKLNPAPDVIVHSGDIVHNGRPGEYAKATAILKAARAPVYVLPGNKDNRENLRVAFSGQGYFAPDAAFIDYAIENYPVRLIALDTLSEGNNRGEFGPERIARLNKLIDAETSKPIAVFTHHPPFEVPVGPDPINFVTPSEMLELRAAMQKSGRVIGVFSGHVHRATAGHAGRIPATVVPCVATMLRKGDFPAEMKERPIYYTYNFTSNFTSGSGFTTEMRFAAA